MSWFMTVLCIVPLWHQYARYRRLVMLQAAALYHKDQRVKRDRTAFEAIARLYLEKNYLTFREWLKAVKYGA